MRPIAAVHIGVQDLDQAFVSLAYFGLGHGIPHLQNLDRAAFGGRQFAGATDGGGVFAGVAGGVFAQHLMRVINAQPGPGALFFGFFAKRLGLTFPDPVFFDLLQKLLFRRAVEKVPLQIVFTHVVFAEPIIIIHRIGRFRGAVFAMFLASRRITGPGRGFKRPRHPPAPARVFLFRA